MIKKYTIIVILISLNKALDARQKRLFHGLGSNCSKDKNIQEAWEAKCVETNDNVFGSYQEIKKQGDTGCKKLTEEMTEKNDIFENGLYLIGLSQGGLIARWIYKNCKPIRNFVKRIITIGTPNLGVDIIQKYFGMDSKIGKYVFENRNQGFSPFCYLNKVEVDDHYSDLINDLLNDDYSNLELMVNNIFREDQMVHPLESSSFGNKFNSDTKEFESFKETKIYMDEKLKLNELYDGGKFYNCQDSGKHLNIDDNFIKFTKNFLDDCSDDQITKYNDCLIKNLDLEVKVEFGAEANILGMDDYNENVLKYLKCEGYREGLIPINEDNLDLMRII